MANEGEQRVTCPECGKAYRWSREIAGSSVACKKCNTGFKIPDVPGKGLRHKPKPAPEPEMDSGDSVYELAFDDDHPEAPGASTATKCPSCNTEVKPDAVICLKCGYNLKERSRVQMSVETHTPPPPPISPTTSPSDEGSDQDEVSEEPVEVSEAVKQQRREEQRKAAAEANTKEGKLKLPLIIGGLVVLLIVIFITILAVSNGLDGILKK